MIFCRFSSCVSKAKEESTEVSIPNIGEPEDWPLVGVADASRRKGALGCWRPRPDPHEQTFPGLHWSSKKIDRVCQSSSYLIEGVQI